MKTTGSLIAFAATAAALTPGHQFVLYAPADDSYSQRADPIITPGKLSGHVHDFAGASTFDKELSYEALQNPDCTTVGSNDLSGGGFSKDNSVYWHPALYAKKKGSGEYMKVPTTLHKMYYRVPPATRYAEPFEFPAGFRMVGGDPFLRKANTETTGITHWQCMGPGTVGEDGGFPDLSAACDVYSGLVSKVHFPHCWNGKEFSQDDPTAHTSYPEGDASSGECPSTHPIALPHIEFENLFEMSSTWEQIDVSTLTLAMGDPTGYGMHGDFFNGWVNGTIPELLETCPQGPYGNQDVGECSAYEPNSVPRGDCKLKTIFAEKVESPGDNLLGCNPISLLNPAPINAIAALGISTSSCGSSDGGSSSDDDSSDASSYSAPASSASGIMSVLPIPSSYAAPTTTFAVSTTSAAYVPEVSYGGWGQEEEDDEYDYVTEWVTATAEATVYAKRDVHNHMNAHRRRHF